MGNVVYDLFAIKVICIVNTLFSDLLDLVNVCEQRVVYSKTINFHQFTHNGY